MNCTGRVTALVLGIPGSGKSTVCKEVAHRLDGAWLSASGVLRAFGAENPEFEARWRSYWDRGDYVPESEVNPVLWQAYLRIKRFAVLLDGYPRTYGQVDEFLQRGARISVAILLLVDEGVALSRIVDRAQRSGRFDDAISVARRRIQNEIANLSALVTHREINCTLVQIDAGLGKAQVVERVIEAVVRTVES
ncbi:MAG: nucleoside monophosphate kinase [Pseudonocardiaceae bacterium]